MHTFTAADFDSSALTFTFNSGQMVPSQSQVIATIEDILVELAETFSLTASDGGNIMINPSSETVTIIDNDGKM